jgi:TonB family protein
MKYKVLIKKCVDTQKAAKISEEIARWSGTSVDVILSAIVKQAVCIRKEAEENDALLLKKQFEAIGAEIELVPLGKAPAVSQAEGLDDEEEVFGRTLTDPEYAEVLSKRPDIFYIEKDARLRNILIVCMIIGLCFGIWMSTVKVVQVATDFFEKIPEERVAKFVRSEVDATLEDQKKKKEEEEKEKKKLEEELKSDKKTLKKESDRKGAGGKFGGGGDPRARVTQKGVLGIISGKVTGKGVASADIFGKGGFASGIDGILQGVGGLKAGGSGGVGRRGAAGIGFGAGYGSGFGGGSGFSGVDDLIGGLLGGEGESSVSLKKRGSLTVSEPKFVKGGALTGGRSRASIMRVVMQNLAALRYAYNKRLREKPGLKGKITCKFAIDEFGKVIFCQVVESTINDPQLEQEVVEKIKRWVFEKIDKPGDITEVEYPFAFSQ